MAKVITKCVNHLCNTFDEYLENHIPYELSWADKVDVHDEFNLRRSEIEDLLQRQRDQQRRFEQRKQKPKYLPFKEIEIVYERKQVKPVVVKAQQPPPMQVRRSEKPACRKGTACVNRKCTFFHADRPPKTNVWPALARQ